MALSQLNPQIIGAEMEHGFAGSYARQPDMIVVTRPVGEKEPLPFGMALMYDANGAVVLMQGSGVTADRFAGVAGREMRSALSYTDQNTGAYTHRRCWQRVPARQHQRAVPEGHPEARRRSVRAHHQEHFAPQCCRGRL